jgi:hypothetical protein
MFGDALPEPLELQGAQLGNGWPCRSASPWRKEPAFALQSISLTDLNQLSESDEQHRSLAAIAGTKLCVSCLTC